jgi:hypothetical protein
MEVLQVRFAPEPLGGRCAEVRLVERHSTPEVRADGKGQDQSPARGDS